ncbi:uncharacterized protein APUU_41473A [Aspergillus puulaauensis]|uniref:FAD-binding domain-containing protein n=1 Tax=Aspergillus puulaauensis TaxID=1220207 RepID=A0A7R8AMI4_9EURO|nr:uncharacterized protein APUU_41473A [Aspergillus puulaauensis]BCS25029.1 hypothetical protein APUU_41473A [Aspergillus puulaauensis]
MTEARPLDIVVIGAGISGLTVLEKSKFNRETGAAINAPPNCTALLEWLDIDLRDFGGTLLEEVNRHDHHGTVKFHTDFDAVRKLWQAEYYLVHRCDLHGALKHQALKRAEVHTGCEIVGIDTSTSRPSVTLDDGRVFEGDLLIGADGLHSIIRKKIAPNAPDPTPADKSCFRWLLPAGELRELSTTTDIARRGALMEWAAAGKARLVMYPCSNNEVLNLVAFMPTAQVGKLGEGWEATGNKKILVNGFADFCPAVRELVGRAGDDLKMWQLYDMEALPHYVDGRVALIGDAAHPFQPYLGQGGAMAIEDAVSLAILLPMGTTVNDIPRRLELYETARRPRVELTLYYTALNARNEDEQSTDTETAAEMAKIMGTIGSHNEVAHSTAVLQEAQSAVGAAASDFPDSGKGEAIVG